MLKVIQNNKGQAMLELGFSIMIILSLIFATIEYGRAYVNYMDVIVAAREGARAGIISPTPEATAYQKAKEYVNNNLKDGTTEVYATTPKVGPGQPLSVRVVHYMDTFFPIVWGGDVMKGTGGKSQIKLERTIIMLQEDV